MHIAAKCTRVRVNVFWPRPLVKRQMEPMEESDDQDSQLQIDLGSGPRPEQKSSTTSGAADKHSAMTWLQAAEQVLRDEGPEMHIRDLTRTILELGIVGRHVDKRFPSPFVC